MKRSIVILGLLGIIFTASAQEAVYGKIPGETPQVDIITTPTEIIARPTLTRLPQEEDTFATYVFTLADIIIFSYEDSTRMEVFNQGGGFVWSGLMPEGGYHTIFPGQGVFLIQSNKEFSVLVGDPLTDQVQGFAAVDNHNTCVAERFFTLQTSNWGGATFIVFAFEDSTVGEIRDSRSGSVMYTFDLDSAEHYSVMASWTPVEVVANKGVSVLSYGDQGYWVPSSNGTFSGQLFYTFRGYIGSWPNDINVIAYNDETHVKITNTETQGVLWEGDIDDGEVHTLRGGAERMYVTIEASKNVTCLVGPFESYASAYARLYCGMDASGAGIGTRFYHPTISGGRLDIFSFYNDNNVSVYDHRTNSKLWSGTLRSGGHQMLNTMHTLYRIESDRGIAIFDEMGDRAGAIFAPPWFAVHPEVAILPNWETITEPAVPVSFVVYAENNGNYFDIIDLEYFNTGAPEFTSTLETMSGDSMPDANSNGIPDSDTLQKEERFGFVPRVYPVDTVPFNAADTMVLMAVSYQDTAKRDTAYLITYIREVATEVNPDNHIYVYPGKTGLFNVWGLNDSYYREDTVDLTWSSTENEAFWPIRVTELTGFDITDSDGDGIPDVGPVDIRQAPYDFQVRVSVPLDAMVGVQDTIYLVGASTNYPTHIYPEEIVTDTAILIVQVEPAPAVLIRPDTTDSTFAGQPVTYPLEVYNNGNGPDVPRIEMVPVNYPMWSHRLLTKDGSGLLPDTDGDGEPDVGTLAGPGGMDSLLLEIHPPYSALSGWLDSTIVYAYSAVFDTVYDSAIVVTKVKGIVDVRIDPDTFSTIYPGQVAEYRLRVSNWGGAQDTIAIWSEAIPDLGWTHEFTYMDGTPLGLVDNDTIIDVGAVDSAETVVVRLVVSPPSAMGEIIGQFDTAMVENRMVYVRTHFTDVPDTINDSVRVLTTFEPIMDIHNYPNPFSGGNGTTFAFSIPQAGYVTLRVYNRAGEHVRTLIGPELGNDYYDLGGTYELFWDGENEAGRTASPGIYLYTIEWRDEDESGLFATRKITKVALLQP